MKLNTQIPFQFNGAFNYFNCKRTKRKVTFTQIYFHWTFHARFLLSKSQSDKKEEKTHSK